MKTLRDNEFSSVFKSVKEMLLVNGNYALVNDKMEVQSMCIYTVKNGKMYDDISFDIYGKSYSREDFEELKEYSVGFQFALLTKQFNFSYSD